MSLRTVGPCLVAVLCLSACGTASDIAGAGPSSESVDPTSAPTEPPPTAPSTPTTQPSTPTSPPPTTPTTQPTKTTPPERPPKELPHVAGAIKFFSSPSENIGCLISRSSIRCDIKQKSYREPAKPASCRLDYGKALQVGREGEAGFMCVGDTVLGAGKILRYHTSSVVGDFGCTSRESGMSCFNLRTRHGFLISREVADTF